MDNSEHVESIIFPNLIIPEKILIDTTVLIHSMGDGSCFFHSILRAFNRQYIESSREERAKMAAMTREYLADALEEIDPKTNKTYYEGLSAGNLAELGKNYEPASLQFLQKLLRSKHSVSHEFHEAISNFFNLDIYILFRNTKDVYILDSNPELLYKKRLSIFILYSQGGDEGHYDVIGIKNSNGTISTLFSHNHYLVQSYLQRYQDLIKQRKH